MTQEAKDKCTACKHHWDGQCCNVYALVQRARGGQEACRFHTGMSDGELPLRQRALKLAS